MLLAVAAVIWLPTRQPLATIQSPLPTPGAAAPSSLSTGGTAIVTVLFVALGAAAGLGFIAVHRAWSRRDRR
jgi:hypothetical protein